MVSYSVMWCSLEFQKRMTGHKSLQGKDWVVINPKPKWNWSPDLQSCHWQLVCPFVLRWLVMRLTMRAQRVIVLWNGAVRPETVSSTTSIRPKLLMKWSTEIVVVTTGEKVEGKEGAVAGNKDVKVREWLRYKCQVGGGDGCCSGL